MKKIAVIGSGFSGLSASALLARQGMEVHVFEKNDQAGGRARTFSAEGFSFDMGPSWYWMPEVYEKFFGYFGKTVHDYLELQQLFPSFTMVFGNEEAIDVPENIEATYELFESIETGAAGKLKKFLSEAELKYRIAMGGFVQKPALSLFEFMAPAMLSNAWKLQLFSSHASLVRKYFKDPRLISILEFPVLFLGARPEATPSLFSMIVYAGLVLGTWYPKGGYGSVANAFFTVAKEQGVIFHFNTPVNSFEITNHQITGLVAGNQRYDADAVVGSADYHHVESLLPEKLRSYSSAYWQSRVMAPSSLVFYLGVGKKVPRLNHHNLFFDKSLDSHASSIYSSRNWPEEPLFYVCCPSKTDTGTAPEGMENLFVLMPVSAGIEDTDKIREIYYEKIMQRLEGYCGTGIRPHVVFKRSYCINDFQKEYNAYKGNAYGLANTLRQTAIFKPKMRSRKISNLFFAGQLTVPGPGVPPAIISGEIAATQLLKSIHYDRQKAF